MWRGKENLKLGVLKSYLRERRIFCGSACVSILVLHYANFLREMYFYVGRVTIYVEAFDFSMVFNNT